MKEISKILIPRAVYYSLLLLQLEYVPKLWFSFVPNYINLLHEVKHKFVRNIAQKTENSLFLIDKENAINYLHIGLKLFLP